MEKLELTGPELIDKLGWKKSKVYYWMSTGKFETIETPEGLKALLTEKDIEKYRNKPGSKNSQTNLNQSENFQNNSNISKNLVQENFNQSKTSEAEVMLKAIETIRYMFDSQINQTKLLVDSEQMTKDEYFELKVEFQTLQNRYNELESENFKLKTVLDETQLELNKTKEENEKLKQPWWKLKKGH